MQTAIFDLDGTLANGDHRIHHLHQPRKDWDSYFKACGDDKPIWPVIDTALTLDCTGWKVEIWTGRSDMVLEETVDWLEVYGLDHLPLRMRPYRDRQPDTTLKEKWLHGARINDTTFNPVIAFEDRQRVVDMWRRNGLICCQVAPGAF